MGTLVVAGCGGGDSGVRTGATGPTATTPVAAATTVPDSSPATQPDSTVPDSSPASTGATNDTEPLGGPARRPEGTWTFVRRLEEANPTYADFVAGQPDAQEWVISPQCDDGPCQLRVAPSDNGYLPAGWPHEQDDPAPRSFTLEPQADGSYSGVDEVSGTSTCTGSDGDVEQGAQRSYSYQLVFLPASGDEAPRLEGSLTVNQIPNTAGQTGGCIEFHDLQGLIAQPTGFWKDVDPHDLTFGTYDWGGAVIDADDYYLGHTADVGQYVHFNSMISMAPACTGDPCTVQATGAAPGDGKATGTFDWKDGALHTRLSYEDTCVTNDGGDLVSQHGYDVVVETDLAPVIVVHGDVLAWTGTYSSVGTPTPEAAAASPTDCFPTNESEAVAAATTQPYFHGL